MADHTFAIGALTGDSVLELAVGALAVVAAGAFWWHFVRLWLVMRGR